MGWLIALAALIVLSFLPVGIYASYDQGGVVTSLTVGPIHIRLYPKQKRRKRSVNTAPNKGTGPNKSNGKPQGTLDDFSEITQLILNFLSDFRRKLRIRNLELRIILANDDPCDLSVNYARAWTVLGNLMPHLERLFVIKKRNLEIECDFLAEKSLVEARIDMTIMVYRLLWIVIYHGFPGLRKYNKIIKRVKGGATS